MAITYRTLPVPAFRDFTTRIAAGPITFGVEWRHLDEALILDYYGPDARARFDHVLPAGFTGTVDEDGLCLHVFGRDDDQEYLRFDCFDEAAHYHLLTPSGPRNVVVEHDVARDGPLLDWALEALRTRLPALLEQADAPTLAEAVRAAIAGDANVFEAALREVARAASTLAAERRPVRVAPQPEAAPGSRR